MFDLKSCIFLIMLITFSCKKENKEGIRDQKQRENDLLKQKSDTLITSILESDDYSVAKIFIRKNNVEIVKKDTLYGPYPSINSKILSNNVGSIN